MYGHLQVVSLSFMDKTEVGRLMSRLQGDVYALQEFLEPRSSQSAIWCSSSALWWFCWRWTRFWGR